jgi:hypothetical protein
MLEAGASLHLTPDFALVYRRRSQITNVLNRPAAGNQAAEET